MARPVTLFTGQWADLPLEVLAQKAKNWGYDGLELACWGDHFEVERAAVSALPSSVANLMCRFRVATETAISHRHQRTPAAPTCSPPQLLTGKQSCCHRFGQEYVHMSRHTSGYRMDSKTDIDFFFT